MRRGLAHIPVADAVVIRSTIAHRHPCHPIITDTIAIWSPLLAPPSRGTSIHCSGTTHGHGTQMGTTYRRAYHTDTVLPSEEGNVQMVSSERLKMDDFLLAWGDIARSDIGKLERLLSNNVPYFTSKEVVTFANILHRTTVHTEVVSERIVSSGGINRFISCLPFGSKQVDIMTVQILQRSCKGTCAASPSVIIQGAKVIARGRRSVPPWLTTSSLLAILSLSHLSGVYGEHSLTNYMDFIAVEEYMNVDQKGEQEHCVTRYFVVPEGKAESFVERLLKSNDLTSNDNAEIILKELDELMKIEGTKNMILRFSFEEAVSATTYDIFEKKQLSLKLMKTVGNGVLQLGHLGSQERSYGYAKDPMEAEENLLRNVDITVLSKAIRALNYLSTIPDVEMVQSSVCHFTLDQGSMMCSNVLRILKTIQIEPTSVNIDPFLIFLEMFTSTEGLFGVRYEKYTTEKSLVEIDLLKVKHSIIQLCFNHLKLKTSFLKSFHIGRLMEALSKLISLCIGGRGVSLEVQPRVEIDEILRCLSSVIDRMNILVKAATPADVVQYLTGFAEISKAIQTHLRDEQRRFDKPQSDHTTTVSSLHEDLVETEVEFSHSLQQLFNVIIVNWRRNLHIAKGQNRPLKDTHHIRRIIPTKQDIAVLLRCAGSVGIGNMDDLLLHVHGSMNSSIIPNDRSTGNFQNVKTTSVTSDRTADSEETLMLQHLQYTTISHITDPLYGPLQKWKVGQKKMLVCPRGPNKNLFVLPQSICSALSTETGGRLPPLLQLPPVCLDTTVPTVNDAATCALPTAILSSWKFALTTPVTGIVDSFLYTIGNPSVTIGVRKCSLACNLFFMRLIGFKGEAIRGELFEKAGVSEKILNGIFTVFLTRGEDAIQLKNYTTNRLNPVGWLGTPLVYSFSTSGKYTGSYVQSFHHHSLTKDDNSTEALSHNQHLFFYRLQEFLVLFKCYHLNENIWRIPDYIAIKGDDVLRNKFGEVLKLIVGQSGKELLDLLAKGRCFSPETMDILFSRIESSIPSDSLSFCISHLLSTSTDILACPDEILYPARQAVSSLLTLLLHHVSDRELFEAIARIIPVSVVRRATKLIVCDVEAQRIVRLFQNEATNRLMSVVLKHGSHYRGDIPAANLDLLNSEEISRRFSITRHSGLLRALFVEIEVKNTSVTHFSCETSKTLSQKLQFYTQEAASRFLYNAIVPNLPLIIKNQCVTIQMLADSADDIDGFCLRKELFMAQYTAEKVNETVSEQFNSVRSSAYLNVLERDSENHQEPPLTKRKAILEAYKNTFVRLVKSIVARNISDESQGHKTKRQRVPAYSILQFLQAFGTNGVPREEIGQLNNTNHPFAALAPQQRQARNSRVSADVLPSTNQQIIIDHDAFDVLQTALAFLAAPAPPILRKCQTGSHRKVREEKNSNDEHITFKTNNYKSCIHVEYECYTSPHTMLGAIAALHPSQRPLFFSFFKESFMSICDDASKEELSFIASDIVLLASKYLPQEARWVLRMAIRYFGDINSLALAPIQGLTLLSKNKIILSGNSSLINGLLGALRFKTGFYGILEYTLVFKTPAAEPIWPIVFRYALNQLYRNVISGRPPRNGYPQPLTEVPNASSPHFYPALTVPKSDSISLRSHYIQYCRDLSQDLFTKKSLTMDIAGVGEFSFSMNIHPCSLFRDGGRRSKDTVRHFTNLMSLCSLVRRKSLEAFEKDTSLYKVCEDNNHPSLVRQYQSYLNEWVTDILALNIYSQVSNLHFAGLMLTSTELSFNGHCSSTDINVNSDYNNCPPTSFSDNGQFLIQVLVRGYRAGDEGLLNSPSEKLPCDTINAAYLGAMKKHQQRDCGDRNFVCHQGGWKRDSKPPNEHLSQSYDYYASLEHWGNRLPNPIDYLNTKGDYTVKVNTATACSEDLLDEPKSAFRGVNDSQIICRHQFKHEINSGELIANLFEPSFIRAVRYKISGNFHEFSVSTSTPTGKGRGGHAKPQTVGKSSYSTAVVGSTAFEFTAFFSRLLSAFEESDELFILVEDPKEADDFSEFAEKLNLLPCLGKNSKTTDSDDCLTPAALNLLSIIERIEKRVLMKDKDIIREVKALDEWEALNEPFYGVRGDLITAKTSWMLPARYFSFCPKDAIYRKGLLNLYARVNGTGMASLHTQDMDGSIDLGVESSDNISLVNSLKKILPFSILLSVPDILPLWRNECKQEVRQIVDHIKSISISGNCTPSRFTSINLEALVIGVTFFMTPEEGNSAMCSVLSCWENSFNSMREKRGYQSSVPESDTVDSNQGRSISTWWSRLGLVGVEALLSKPYMNLYHGRGKSSREWYERLIKATAHHLAYASEDSFNSTLPSMESVLRLADCRNVIPPEVSDIIDRRLIAHLSALLPHVTPSQLLQSLSLFPIDKKAMNNNSIIVEVRKLLARAPMYLINDLNECDSKTLIDICDKLLKYELLSAHSFNTIKSMVEAPIPAPGDDEASGWIPSSFPNPYGLLERVAEEKALTSKKLQNLAICYRVGISDMNEDVDESFE